MKGWIKGYAKGLQYEAVSGKASQKFGTRGGYKRANSESMSGLGLQKNFESSCDTLVVVSAEVKFWRMLSA